MRQELNHWTDQRLEAFAPCSYIQQTHWKPSGLWFDVDRDWQRWCKGEDFRRGHLAFRHRLRLAADAKILWLSGEAAVREFSRAFRAPHPLLDRFPDLFSDDYYIDWRAVAAQYQGIVIAPYAGAMRMNLIWYYTWDCASGCIWDPSAVTIDAVYHKGRRV